MGAMKTPGVYIVEKSAFPNSVVEVATAVPAFIGYTDIADNHNKSLRNKPWRITSMAEYHQYFGFGPHPSFDVVELKNKDEVADFVAGGKDYVTNQLAGPEGGGYSLYNSLRFFYQNGGGPCYVVSVGSYRDSLDPEALNRGLDELLKEQEPTMVIIPEAVGLKQDACIALQQAMLSHCGEKMRNRIAILDVWGGDKPRQHPTGDPIEQFRNQLGINFLNFATAYYPWLNTTVVGEKELSFNSISMESRAVLSKLLHQELGHEEKLPENAPAKKREQWQAVEDVTKDWSVPVAGLSSNDIENQKALLHKTLVTISPLYNTVLGEIRRKLNVMPPSAAMAGIYTMVDNTRGEWGGIPLCFDFGRRTRGPKRYNSREIYQCHS
jgi:uncharacterized protein